MIDRLIYKILGSLDKLIQKVDNLFTNKKRKSK